MNPLKQLQQYEQSIWLDYIDRHLVSTDGLVRLMADDDLRGLTSNPAIFEKAIASDGAYQADLQALRGQGLAPMEMLERLVLPDIRAAAVQLRPVYESSQRRDGYVSLEVPPTLAFDTQATLLEARRLWHAVGQDNLMIKVPATPAGLPAITQLIAEGINVNVTLLFSRKRYVQVAEAYLAGLAQRAADGHALDGVASVASFFVSRIDTVVDERLADALEACGDACERGVIRSLMGRAAIANAKLAYQHYQMIYSGAHWRALAEQGAQTQRLLWASTGVKNPAYRDVLYIEELIGANTVNTVPPATLAAFREHGRVRPSLEEDVSGAAQLLSALADRGIALERITEQLLDAGLTVFVQAYDKLLTSLAR